MAWIILELTENEVIKRALPTLSELLNFDVKCITSAVLFEEDKNLYISVATPWKKSHELSLLDITSGALGNYLGISESNRYLFLTRE